MTDHYSRDMFTNRPISMNESNNLLEIEEHMYILDDVKKPNVFRNMFPYSEVPKIPFNDRIVPHNMPKEIWITDTTFRDGQQSRAPYTTDQIVAIYDYLHRLGGPKGLIRACEFFLYSKKDRDAVYQCMERGYRFPEVTSWIRASKEDFKLVKEIGMKEIEQLSLSYLELTVTDVRKAAYVLSDRMNLSNFKILENGEIRIYDMGASTQELSKSLILNDVEVISIGKKAGNLEEYFLKMTAEQQKN